MTTITSLVDPSLLRLGVSLSKTLDIYRSLCAKDPVAFHCNQKNDEITDATMGVYRITEFGINHEPDPRYLYNKKTISNLLVTMRKVGNVLPQLYTHDTRARNIIDGVLTQREEAISFGTFMNGVQHQIHRVETQLKLRFPDKAQTVAPA